jgi:hypothetical protein
MKNTIYGLLLAGAICSQAASAETALKMAFWGKNADYNNIQNTIGKFVVDLTITKYVLEGTGIEGGRWVCIETWSEETLAEVRSKIERIKLSSDGGLQLTPAASCSQ